jgi:glycosyltransferase involved in cell wall biosynthesis
MKIVHISTSNNLVPPEGYGGTERVVHWLSKAQVEAGHTVYVVAPEGGDSSTTNIPVSLWSSEEEAYDASYQAILDVDPDIVHDHTFSQLFRLRHPDVLGISTHHNERFQPVSNTVYPTVADAKANGSDVFVHHGLDLSEYSFCDDKGEFLLFLGAIHPRKNVDLAISISEKSKVPLVISGPVRHPGYFAKKIRKRISENIVYRGESFGVIKKHLLKKARAFLYPSSWESFGLSVIEAMVSGTPVIVSDIPPFHEIVQEGVTGFICKNKKDYLRAVDSLPDIQASVCRDHVVKNFNNEKMAKEYENLYGQVLNSKHW